MAGRGTVPKAADKRVRRNATPPETELGPGDATGTPALPGASRMLAATKRWYAEWCSSEQARQFLRTDWLRLHMVALLVDDFYRTKSVSERKQLLAEIRLNEQKLGATAEDRLRLRWKLAEAERVDEREQRAASSPRRRPSDPRLQLVQGRTA